MAALPKFAVSLAASPLGRHRHVIGDRRRIMLSSGAGASGREGVAMAIRYVDIQPEDGNPPKRPEAARIVDPKPPGHDAAPPRLPADDLPAAAGKTKRRKR